MLKNSFFRIRHISASTDTNENNPHITSYRIAVSLDPGHPIYGGHFPGNPVVPGVCQLRMVTEIISEITGGERKLLEGDNIKFLSMINPLEHPDLTVTCTVKEGTPGILYVTASISDDDTIFFKCKSILA